MKSEKGKLAYSAKTKASKASSPELSEVDDEDLHSGSEDEEDLEELSDDEDVDVDAPRVAQWVDDDELDEADALSSESEESAHEENQDLGEGPSRINLVRSSHFCMVKPVDDLYLD